MSSLCHVHTHLPRFRAAPAQLQYSSIRGYDNAVMHRHTLQPSIGVASCNHSGHHTMHQRALHQHLREATLDSSPRRAQLKYPTKLGESRCDTCHIASRMQSRKSSIAMVSFRSSPLNASAHAATSRDCDTPPSPVFDTQWPPSCAPQVAQQ